MGCVPTKPTNTRRMSIETNIIVNELSSFPQKYIYRKFLGHGRYGRVLLGENMDTGQLVAIKAISKQQAGKSIKLLMEEIRLLSEVDHPNIVKYLEHFESEKYLYIVMEYCPNGDLFHKVIEREKFTESEAAKIMQELLRAINHCHHLDIIHRDLKPENIMYSAEGTLKIIDFGLSMKDKTLSHESLAGTGYYISPEIIKDEIFTKACDIWSLGIIMHILLSGYIPIIGDSQDELYSNILNFKGPKLTGDIWRNVSDDAKILLRKMLDPDYKTRITAADALNQRWFSSKLGKDNNEMCCLNIIGSLKEYSKFTKLKKKALNLLILNICESDLKKMQQVFLELDHNKTGLITCAELKDCLIKGGYEITAEELENLTRKISYNGEAYINYTEFLAATIKAQKFLTEEKLWNLFKALDVEKQGHITETNLKTILSRPNRLFSCEVKEIMKETDRDHDGKITFNEFKEIFKEHTDDSDKI